jgi:hypothetical protein
MKKGVFILALTCAVMLASCADSSTPAPNTPVIRDTGVIYSPDDVPPDAPTLEPTMEPNGEPHYYATALQEIMSNAVGNVNAVLFDLDGCGNDEMIVFDEGTGENREHHWIYAEGARMAVFDVKDGENVSSVIELDFLLNGYDLYVTSKNYIVVCDYWEETFHQIFMYKEGVLAEVATLSKSWMGTYAPYYHIDNIEISEFEYNNKLNEFGIEEVFFVIGSYRGIHTELPPRTDTDEILAMTVDVLIESGDNFKVYDITKNNQPEYRYEIYNNNGVVVKNETAWRTYPHITTLFGDTALSITQAVGTGTFLTQYYDIGRDLFSEIFETPFTAEHGMVVYVDISEGDFKLIVRDIFDISEFYKEFEMDFSPVANSPDAVRHVEFLDRNTLQVSYLSGVEYSEKMVTLRLN